MSRRSQMSIAMLPIEDMAEYFEKIIGFKKKDDAAEDTKKVAQIDADKIAIAALDGKGNLVNDRNTVNNALQLGGISAENYLTKNDSTSLLTDTHIVSVNMADDIKALKDELYQMRGELVKNGVISDTTYYGGFQDPFREGKEKYLHEELTRIAQADGRVTLSDITVSDSSEFATGEYIVVKSNNSKQLTKITDKQGDRLFISPAINGPLDEFTGIYKSLGSYNDGMYVFGEKTGTLISPEIKQMILKDGKVRKKVRELSVPNTGFATTMSIPRSMGGVIKKIEVALAASGNPGAIKASVYKIATEGFELLGSTDSLTSSNATIALNDLSLTFNEQIILEAGSDYILLLHTTWADENNKWYVGGFDEPCLDGIHKDCYDYIDEAFTLSEDISDMYLAITVSEVLEDQIEYFQKGLYSCNISLPTNTKVTRVRVELKVNREGRFKVVDNPSTLVPSENANLELVNIDNKSYGSAGIFQTDGLIAIGNQIAKVGNNRVNNTSFTLKEAAYAPGGSDVYRIGYKVISKAKMNKINYDTPNNPIITEYSTVIELPLVAVIHGKENGKEDISSDRLIFETELMIDEDNGYKLLDFNEIEAQVIWTTEGVNSQELQTHKELAGKILDITISTDRAYSKRNQ